MGSPSCGVEGGGSVTEKIVNQGDKRSFIAGLRAQARGSKEHSGMPHSWTMLFLTVPLAAGREGDSCGPQGSCLLCHGPTARECMLRGRSFFPDDNTKPALVDWRPFIFVTILVIGIYEFEA